MDSRRDDDEALDIPDEVLKLFQSCERLFAEFAAKHRMRIGLYEDYDQPSDASSWNFYGRCWGRNVCFQVSTYPELARTGHFQVWVYTDQAEIYGPLRASSSDYLPITDSLVSGDDHQELWQILDNLARQAARFVGQLPWHPAWEPASA